MPEISVIMGVYNQLNKEVLLEAVHSILDQSLADFEFIIYDDGSCPEAAELLREVKQLDKRIILIGRAENHGLAFSLNECIHRARGNILRGWTLTIYHTLTGCRNRRIFWIRTANSHG